jgi:membrane protein DedA with SNARE-associated domain
MIHSLVLIWFGWVKAGGYAGIFLLMVLESTIVPVPSEIVVAPAAYWASQGQMDIWAVILASTLGSYVGSAISYWVCRLLGSEFLYRHGHRVFLKPDHLRLAETLFKEHGSLGVFFSRMLPVVRHLISIPSGLFRMNFKLFSAVTIAGAGLWCTILALWGQKVIGKHPELLESPEQMSAAIRSEMSGFVFAIVGFAILYGFVIWYKQTRLTK